MSAGTTFAGDDGPRDLVVDALNFLTAYFLPIDAAPKGTSAWRLLEAMKSRVDGFVAACAATKPSETSFDGWFRKFSGRLSGESTRGAAAGGVVGKVREAYEVYARTLLQSIGVSSSGVASMAFWRPIRRWNGGNLKVRTLANPAAYRAARFSGSPREFWQDSRWKPAASCR